VIVEQGRAIEELTAVNTRLVERVAQLARIVGRNSGNSSMPPSSDDLPGRTKPAPKPGKGSGRRRGKQQGAKGSSLRWMSTPDERVAHRPEGRCGCGADLGEASEVGIERSCQEHDLPEIRVRVRQHDVYRVRCACGCEHVGALPAGVSPAPSSSGVNLKSLVVYLLIYQHVPVQRCVALLGDLTGGAGPSGGFVPGMLTRAAAAVRPVVTLIKELISGAAVVGFDETTLRAGPAGTKRYVLSASTEDCTAFHLGRRDLGSFTAFGILPRFGGIAVHDRYQNYYHPTWKHLAGHQACCAHLLRDFTDAAQSNPGAHWPGQAQRAICGLIHAWHQARDAGLTQIPPPIRDPLISEFRHAIRVGLAQVTRVPGRNTAPNNCPDATCWSSAATTTPTSWDSAPTPGSGPPTTSANATCGPPRPSRRSPAGSPARTSPKTAWTSAATSTPSANTTATSSPPSTPPSPAIPGAHPSPHQPDNLPQAPSPAGQQQRRQRRMPYSPTT
jgi:transposase